MSLFKRFSNFLGLDLRNSDILREDDYASDLLNVELNKRRELVKRFGHTEIENTEGGNGLFNYDGDTELISLGSNVSGLVAGAWANKTNSGALVLNQDNLGSSVENNKNLYIGTGKNELIKYDGLSYYRAGVPNTYPRHVLFMLNGTGGAAASKDFEYRVQFQSVDRNRFVTTGTILNPDAACFVHTSTDLNTSVQFIGPKKTYAELVALGVTANMWAQGTIYVIQTVIYAPDNAIYESVANHTATNTGGGNELVDFQTDLALNRWILLEKDVSGFNARGAIVSGDQVGVNTGKVLAGFHDVIVGDLIKVPLSLSEYSSLERDQGCHRPFNFEQFRTVTAVGATTITFDGAPASFPSTYVISVGLYVNIYNRENLSGSDFITAPEVFANGQKVLNQVGVNPFTVIQAVEVERESAFVGSAFSQPITASGFPAQGLPPKGRYMEIFQQSMIIMGLDDDEHGIAYSRNQFVEEFPEADQRITIGDSREGVLTGGIVNNDFLVIFKEREIYNINGNLTGGNFRVDKTHSAGVGCSAHATIKELDRGVVFLGERGVFMLTGGNKPEEISEFINQLITEDSTGLDFSLAQAVNDTKNQKCLFFIPSLTGGIPNANSRILVWDYFANSWWVWSGMDLHGGATIFNRELHFVDGTVNKGLQQRSAIFNDNGQAIPAFYKTSWFNFGEPSLFKKICDIKLFALGLLNFTLDVKNEKNWQAGIFDTEVTKTFDAANRVVKNNMASKKAVSMRFTFENNVLDEGILLTGYELEVEAPQGAKLKK